MAALAYVLLPVTGLLAFSMGTGRVRFHGLQAIIFGLVWPLLLLAASFSAPIATQVVFVVGCIVWVWLLLATALGRDPALPGLRGALVEGAGADPLAGRETHST
jgi:uncharacterized membrane protein